MKLWYTIHYTAQYVSSFAFIWERREKNSVRWTFPKQYESLTRQVVSGDALGRGVGCLRVRRRRFRFICQYSSLRNFDQWAKKKMASSSSQDGWRKDVRFHFRIAWVFEVSKSTLIREVNWVGGTRIANELGFLKTSFSKTESCYLRRANWSLGKHRIWVSSVIYYRHRPSC